MSAAYPTALVLHPDCGRHDTGWGHPEHQGRLPAIVHAIYQETPALLDRVLQREGTHARSAQIARVHTAPHIGAIEAAAETAERTGTGVRVGPGRRAGNGRCHVGRCRSPSHRVPGMPW